MPSVLEQLCSAKVFTKLDLRSAYLVCINLEEVWKTTFSPTSRHCKYIGMLYGLSGAPSVFQCLINVLRDMLWKFMIVDISDILIYSLSLEEHALHVK